MIRVRYRDSNDLSPGLHAAAERHGRSTTVYLLSGLTAPQRRSALRRLRLSARMGHCPRLPAAQLALALAADRIRTAVRRAGAVFRLHPAGSTVPVMVLSGGAIAFLLFSTVSIHVMRTPRANAQSSASGTSPDASAGAIPITGASQGQAAGPGRPGSLGQGSGGQQSQPGSGGLGGSSRAQSPSLAGAVVGRGAGGLASGNQGSGSQASGSQASGSQASGSQGSGSQGSGGQASGGQGGAAGSGSGKSSGGGTPQSGGANPAPTSGTSQGATSAPPPATAPAAAPSSPAASGSGGVCVSVGPLGVCLNI